jgi:mRNA interferase MazF
MNNQTNINKEIKRGDIYWVHTPQIEGSSQQSGLRPFMITSNNFCNLASSVLTGIPITSVLTKSKLPTHVVIENYEEVGLKKESVLLVEQITRFDKSLIRSYIGKLNNKTVEKVNIAIDVQTKGFDMKEAFKKFKDVINMKETIIKYKKKGVDIDDLALFYNNFNKEFLNYCKVYNKNPEQIKNKYNEYISKCYMIS